MKKLGLLLSALVVIFGLGFSQEPTYDKAEISGHVFDESRNPLAGIKVELSGGGVWAVTDEKGYYCIKGVPVPNRYTLQVRYAENFFPADVQVIIDSAAQKKFEADIILRARTKKGTPPVPTPPAKAGNPEVAKAMAMAKEAVKNKKPEEAIAHIQKAIALEPDNAGLHYDLAVLLRQTGKIDEAVAEIEKALKLQPDFPLFVFGLGETLQIRKEYEKSNEFLMKLLTGAESENIPAQIRAKINYLVGANFFNLKQPDKAIPSLSQAIELDPKIDANAYIMLGNSYVMTKDGINAINNYKKYVELYPDAPNIQQVKAILEKLESMYKDEKK